MKWMCQHKRVLTLIALVAIVVALVFLLVPQGHSAHVQDWLALLPVYFVGLLLPLMMPVRVACRRTCPLPAAPVLANAFERPPPFRLG
jgi:hypothetical protein